MVVNLVRAFCLLAGGLLLAPSVVYAAGGTAIKAYGSGPDWELAILEKGNRISFTLNGETGHYRYGSQGPGLYSDRNLHVYRVLDDAHSMNVFVYSKACRDAATGKSHEVSVIVTRDAEEYRGCGDVLTQLLTP